MSSNKAKMFQPKLVTKDKSTNQYGSMYVSALREALFTHFEKPYKAPEVPLSIFQEGDNSHKYICRQCKDCFHHLSSLDEHTTRGSWILGYWCTHCFQECEHLAGKKLYCSKCIKLQIQKYKALQTRGLKKSDEPGIVKIFFNPCQLLAHMQMHNSEEISIHQLMLLPFPSGIGKEYFPHLKMISEALMDFMFLTNIHIIDWLLQNKIHKWWRMAKGDNPVANIIKKYPFEVQQIKQLLNCNNKVNQNNKSNNNYSNISVCQSEKSTIDSGNISNANNSMSCKSLSNSITFNSSISSSQNNFQSDTDITFVDCGPCDNVRNDNVNNEIIAATNCIGTLSDLSTPTSENLLNTRSTTLSPKGKISVKKFAKVPASPLRNNATMKSNSEVVPVSKFDDTSANPRVVTIRSAKPVDLTSLIKSFPQIAHKVANKKIVFIRKNVSKDMELANVRNLENDRIQKISVLNPENIQHIKNQKVIQVHKLQHHCSVSTKLENNASKFKQKKSIQRILLDRNKFKTKVVKKPAFNVTNPKSYSSIKSKNINKTNGTSCTMADVKVPSSTMQKQLISKSPEYINNSSTIDFDTNVSDKVTSVQENLDSFLATLKTTSRKVLEQFFQEEELMFLTVIKNEKSGKSFLSVARDRSNTFIHDQLAYRNKMFSYLSKMSRPKVYQRVSHIKAVSRKYSEKVGLLSDEIIEGHKQLISILENIAKHLEPSVQSIGDDYFGPLLDPNSRGVCSTCNKITKPSEYLVGFSNLATDLDYCLCYDFICYQCNTFQGTKDRLHNHLRYHKSENPYICPECNLSFVSLQNLNVHIWTKCFHPLVRRFLSCSICEINGFYSLESIVNHFVIMHSFKMAACSLCCMVFEFKRYCISHMKKGHPEILSSDGPLQLTICQLDDKIIPIECYTYHMRNHKCVEESIFYYCNLCHLKLFKTQETIKAHIYKCHYSELTTIIDIESLKEILLMDDIKQLMGENLVSVKLDEISKISNEKIIEKLKETSTMTNDSSEHVKTSLYSLTEEVITLDNNEAIDSFNLSKKIECNQINKTKSNENDLIETLTITNNHTPDALQSENYPEKILKIRNNDSNAVVSENLFKKNECLQSTNMENFISTDLIQRSLPLNRRKSKDLESDNESSKVSIVVELNSSQIQTNENINISASNILVQNVEEIEPSVSKNNSKYNSVQNNEFFRNTNDFISMETDKCSSTTIKTLDNNVKAKYDDLTSEKSSSESKECLENLKPEVIKDLQKKTDENVTDSTIDESRNLKLHDVQVADESNNFLVQNFPIETEENITSATFIENVEDKSTENNSNPKLSSTKNIKFIKLQNFAEEQAAITKLKDNCSNLTSNDSSLHDKDEENRINKTAYVHKEFSVQNIFNKNESFTDLSLREESNSNLLIAQENDKTEKNIDLPKNVDAFKIVGTETLHAVCEIEEQTVVEVNNKNTEIHENISLEKEYNSNLLSIKKHDQIEQNIGLPTDMNSFKIIRTDISDILCEIIERTIVAANNKTSSLKEESNSNLLTVKPNNQVKKNIDLTKNIDFSKTVETDVSGIVSENINQTVAVVNTVNNSFDHNFSSSLILPELHDYDKEIKRDFIKNSNRLVQINVEKEIIHSINENLSLEEENENTKKSTENSDSEDFSLEIGDHFYNTDLERSVITMNNKLVTAKNQEQSIFDENSWPNNDENMQHAIPERVDKFDNEGNNVESETVIENCEENAKDKLPAEFHNKNVNQTAIESVITVDYNDSREHETIEMNHTSSKETNVKLRESEMNDTLDTGKFTEHGKATLVDTLEMNNITCHDVCKKQSIDKIPYNFYNEKSDKPIEILTSLDNDTDMEFRTYGNDTVLYKEKPMEQTISVLSETSNVEDETHEENCMPDNTKIKEATTAEIVSVLDEIKIAEVETIKENHILGKEEKEIIVDATLSSDKICNSEHVSIEDSMFDCEKMKEQTTIREIILSDTISYMEDKKIQENYKSDKEKTEKQITFGAISLSDKISNSEDVTVNEDYIFGSKKTKEQTTVETISAPYKIINVENETVPENYITSNKKTEKEIAVEAISASNKNSNLDNVTLKDDCMLSNEKPKRQRTVETIYVSDKISNVEDKIEHENYVTSHEQTGEDTTVVRILASDKINNLQDSTATEGCMFGNEKIKEQITVEALDKVSKVENETIQENYVTSNENIEEKITIKAIPESHKISNTEDSATEEHYITSKKNAVVNVAVNIENTSEKLNDERNITADNVNTTQMDSVIIALGDGSNAEYRLIENNCTLVNEHDVEQSIIINPDLDNDENEVLRVDNVVNVEQNKEDQIDKNDISNNEICIDHTLVNINTVLHNRQDVTDSDKTCSEHLKERMQDILDINTSQSTVSINIENIEQLKVDLDDKSNSIKNKNQFTPEIKDILINNDKSCELNDIALNDVTLALEESTLNNHDKSNVSVCSLLNSETIKSITEADKKHELLQISNSQETNNLTPILLWKGNDKTILIDSSEDSKLQEKDDINSVQKCVPFEKDQNLDETPLNIMNTNNVYDDSDSIDIQVPTDQDIKKIDESSNETDNSNLNDLFINIKKNKKLPIIKAAHKCNTYELKNLPLTDDEKITLSKTSATKSKNFKSVDLQVTRNENVKQLRTRIVNKLNHSNSQVSTTKRKICSKSVIKLNELQDQKEGNVKKSKIDIKESDTKEPKQKLMKRQKVDTLKHNVNSKSKLKKLISKNEGSKDENNKSSEGNLHNKSISSEIKEIMSVKRNSKRNRTFLSEDNLNSDSQKMKIKNSLLLQMPTLRLIKTPTQLNPVNFACHLEKTPSLKAVKKYKIGFCSNVDSPTKVCKFKCHLCGDAINTSWSIISDHYNKKHAHNYELCTISLQLTRFSHSDTIDINTKKINKRKSVETPFINMKRRKRWSPKKVNEKPIITAERTSGLFVQLESVLDGEGHFKCKKCDERCVDMIELRQHIGDNHRIAKKNLICLECGENFVVSPSLQMHLRAFHGIDDPIAYMNQYPSYAPEIIDFEAEAKTTAANQCHVCMAVFKDKLAVDKHLRVHGMAFLNRKRIEARNAQLIPSKKEKHEKDNFSPNISREICISQENLRNKHSASSNFNKTTSSITTR